MMFAKIKLIAVQGGYEAFVESRHGSWGPCPGASPDEPLGHAIREIWLGGDLDEPIKLEITSECHNEPDPALADHKATLCKHCHHFVEANDERDVAGGCAAFIHLEDGEQEFDHDAEPGNVTKTLAEWRRDRPELFQTYPDGKIGPNSIYHQQPGKK